MAIAAGEQQSGGEVRDSDGRLIVVGPGGVGIGGGGGGSDPLSDGTPGGALPSKTLWVAGADGTVLRGIAVNASGHVLTAVQNFPASQAVSDGGGSLTVDGTVTANAGTGPWPVTDNGGTLSVDDGAGSLTVDGSVSVSNFPATQPVSLATNTPDVTDRDARVLGRTKIHDGTNVASVLNAAPGSDTGQSALAVRVVSQLGAGSGGGGSAGTIDAPADNVSPTLAQHVQAFLSCFDGTNWDRVRGDTTNGIDVDVTRVQGTVATTVGNFPATQPVSGTVTANAGTGPWPVTDNGGSLTVDGTVNIGSAPQVAVNNVETLTDNAGFTDGTSKLFPQGYIFDESAGAALTENDIAAARVDSKRAVVNVLEDATTRGRRAVISATGGLLGDQGAPATQTNAWFVRPRKLATYWAPFRATTRPYNLDKTFTANTRVQFATIHHAASATKTVRLRRVRVIIHALITSAAELNLDLVRITAAPATGNPAITPGISENSDAAAEATCLALPTTAGTEGAVIESRYMSYGVTAGASIINPPPVFASYELLEPGPGDDETKLPTIRAGVLEGWAVTIDSTAATRLLARVEIQFTEE